MQENFLFEYQNTSYLGSHKLLFMTSYTNKNVEGATTPLPSPLLRRACTARLFITILLLNAKIPFCFRYSNISRQDAKKILRPQGKRERQDPLQAKQAESFQGLDINFGKLLLVYFMRPPRP